MTVTIKKEHFGKTQDGKEVTRFVFEGGRVTVAVLDFGCAIQSVHAPDNQGRLADVALGYDQVQGYEKNLPYIGVVVGRVAGRIAGGRFSMDGQDYSLTINNGPNNIHGGVTGFSRRLWQSSIDGNVLKMTYSSPDGEDGFPGDVNVTVTYELSEDGSLTLEYTATSSKPCPINLTNHVYLNLSGHNSDDVFDHVAQITADTYVPVNNDLIPTGELSSVADTAVDLRQPTRLRERELAIRRGDLDVTYCVGESDTLKLVSRISHPVSGRFIDTFTTEPGLQFYTAKYMADAVGKGDKQYQPFASFCLETQHYPDSVNHSNFPNTILRPGETYRQKTIYTFGVE